MNRQATRLLLTATLPLLLAGCGTPKPIPEIKISSPAPDEALVYLFRPALDKEDLHDYPNLIVDGKTATALSSRGYTALSLHAGVHRLQLAPGKGEDDSWEIQQDLEVESGQTLYIAIWHQGQPQYGRGITVINHNGSVNATGTILGHLIGAIMRRQSNDLEGIVFEQVEPDIGAEALKGLRYFSPKTDHLAARQAAARSLPD